MNKHYSILLILALVSLLLWCTKKEPPKQTLTIHTVRVDSIATFPYVAYAIPANATNLYEYIKNFLNEVEQQQIIPTGPLFLITGFREGNQWALCFPIAEGTIVKEPLTIQRWDFEEIVRLQAISSLQEIDGLEKAVRLRVDSLLNQQVSLGNPVAIRMIHYSSTSFNPSHFQSEIWIPVTNTTY